MNFRPYAEHGWALCRIKEREKGPNYTNWNKKARAVTPDQAEHLPGAGLMHAYSGTCALDIDNLDMSRAYMAQHGIDLDALLQAADSVGISSGTTNRAKLLFALPVPLPTKKIVDDQKVTLFELRCADASCEGTVQDVLPPSIHPSGREYRWVYGDELTGTWQDLPPLPDALRALWASLTAQQPQTRDRVQHENLEPVRDADIAFAEELLERTSPDVGYDEWLRIGMALSNDLGEQGWEMWNAWSAKGTKYPGESQLASHWNSFGRSSNPVTLGSFKRQQIAQREDFADLTLNPPEDENPFDVIAAEQKASKSLKLWSLEEIQTRPWPEWHVLDILPRAEINMLYGESGVGKSALALDMTLAVAQGIPWFGHDTEQGPVIWLAAEAFGSMKPRTRAYAMHNAIEWSTLTGLPFHVVEQFNLSNADLVASLVDAVKDIKPSIVVVDTLAAATGGANENSGEDMGAILDACRAIYHGTGGSVLLIHHSGKNAELGARGWSGIKAAVQAELKVAFDEGTSQRVFSSTKQRDGESGLAYGFSLAPLVVGEDTKLRPITSVAVKFNGKVEEKIEVTGDGNGKRAPRNLDQSIIWGAFLELQPLSPDGVVDRDELIREALRRSGTPDSNLIAQRKSFVGAIKSLAHAQYIIADGERITMAEAAEPEEGHDLV